MENQAHETGSKLFDLLESKTYADLSPEEKQFVDLHMTEEAYSLQRLLITTAGDVFETSIPEVLPLQLPEPSKKEIVIPLYQALLAVASVIIVFLMIWPSGEELAAEKQQKGIGAKVFKIHPVLVAHDTVIRYVPETVVYERRHTDTVIRYIKEKVTEEPKLLDVAQTLSKPVLEGETIENKGSSLKEDRSSRFLIPVKSAY